MSLDCLPATIRAISRQSLAMGREQRGRATGYQGLVMHNTTDTILKIAAASLLMVSAARAEYVVDADSSTPGNQPGSVYTPIGLGGTTMSEGWEKLTSTLYPGNGSFPGTSAWVGALGSQVGPDAGANGLGKVSNGFAGGPYPASASVYFGGILNAPNVNGGTLEVDASSTGLLSGVKTVVFHLDIGEAWTYDLYNRVAPSITVNTTSGTFTRSAVFASRYAKVYNGQVWMNGKYEDLYINSRAYQFDLNSLGTVTGFTITFSGVQHAQVHGLGLEQSTDVNTTNNTLPTDLP